MDLTVGIVNWNGRGYLRPCLERVLAEEEPGYELSVIVFDNNSSDDSIGEISDLALEGVEVIRSDSNIGFAGAHNRIIDRIRSQFYMPLNFDVFLEGGYIAEILAMMAEDEKIGMATGKLRKMVGFVPQPVLDSTGIDMRYYMPHPRGEMDVDEGQYDVPACRYIFGPCGAAPIYRMKMLEDIRLNGEYFDEHFFNYFEDVDLAWRAQLRGWKGLYVHTALAFHERGVTRKYMTSEKKQLLERGHKNRYLTMYKNITPFEIKTCFHKLFVKEFLFLLAFHDRDADPATKFRAFISAYKARKRFKGKRLSIQENKRIKPSDLLPFFHYSDSSSLVFIFYGLMKVSLGILYNAFRISILFVNAFLKPFNLEARRQSKFTYKIEKTL